MFGCMSYYVSSHGTINSFIHSFIRSSACLLSSSSVLYYIDMWEVVQDRDIPVVARDDE